MHIWKQKYDIQFLKRERNDNNKTCAKYERDYTAQAQKK